MKRMRKVELRLALPWWTTGKPGLTHLGEHRKHQENLRLFPPSLNHSFHFLWRPEEQGVAQQELANISGSLTGMEKRRKDLDIREAGGLEDFDSTVPFPLQCRGPNPDSSHPSEESESSRLLQRSSQSSSSSSLSSSSLSPLRHLRLTARPILTTGTWLTANEKPRTDTYLSQLQRRSLRLELVTTWNQRRTKKLIFAKLGTRPIFEF